jgi:hypothetical protein
MVNKRHFPALPGAARRASSSARSTPIGAVLARDAEVPRYPKTGSPGAVVELGAPCSRSWRSTAALALDVAQALLGERCGLSTSAPSWPLATPARRGALAV